MLLISHSITPQRCSIEFRNGKATEVHSIHCLVYGTSLRQLVLCDLAHYHAGSSYYKMVNCGHKVKQYSHRLWHSISTLVVL